MSIERPDTIEQPESKEKLKKIQENSFIGIIMTKEKLSLNV